MDEYLVNQKSERHTGVAVLSENPWRYCQLIHGEGNKPKAGDSIQTPRREMLRVLRVRRVTANRARWLAECVRFDPNNRKG